MPRPHVQKITGDMSPKVCMDMTSLGRTLVSQAWATAVEGLVVGALGASGAIEALYG